VPGVYVDNEQGTLLALEHLWQLGHRSIVCVVDERMADGPFRAAVYEAFMRDHGLATASGRTSRAAGPEPGYRLGRELFAHLDRPDHPTAVFAASDTIAIGSCRRRSRPGSSCRTSSRSSASTTSTSRRSRSRP
jgi:DNA-binding LacI/PurR family transcriptional regulator